MFSTLFMNVYYYFFFYFRRIIGRAVEGMQA